MFDAVAEALGHYAEQTSALAIMLEGLESDDLSDEARNHAGDVLDFANGYTGARQGRGVWISGVLELLENLLEDD